jgi:diguanylate cyclase (GGDEF)-like protein
MRITLADKAILDTILERKRREDTRVSTIDLKGMLRNILSWANRFVPSESGSILLDDPTMNQHRQKPGMLYFIACFGKGSSGLAGTILPVNVGIVGKTYMAGKAYISKKVKEDSNFYAGIDKKTKFRTQSIICAPIKIKSVTIGAIELINRLHHIDYDQNDLTLLKIFAEHTSTLIQNSLDAKKFGELSIRDNLTGLYNDRYFYERLTKEVGKAKKKGLDLSVIFMDLDRFKEINDAHGHLVGSRVLAEVGEILLGELNYGGAITVRYGGDEFVMVLPSTGIKAAKGYAEKLRETIEKTVFIKRKRRGIESALKIKGLLTCSAGVASLKTNTAPNDSLRKIRDTLIRKADNAMYESKKMGKNRVSLAS